MKTLPRTRLIVIAAIGLTCIAAIVVFAKSPSPTKKPKDLPFQLSMKDVLYASNNLTDALNNTKLTDNKPLADHKDHFKLLYDDDDVGNGTYTNANRGKNHTNVTQHLALESSDELKIFLETAFPTATPTPTP